MTHSTGKRPFHFKNVIPGDPAVKPIDEWFPPNRGFYAKFRQWLKAASYSDSAIHQYGTAVRIALGWLDKPYWEIDQADLDRVRQYITGRYESEATRTSYFKGIAKLDEYLRHRCHRPALQKPINWGHYVGPLPDWLSADVRDYITHRRHNWLPEQRHRSTITTLSHLTRFLRWLASNATLTSIGDLTPALWFDYLDERLAAGRSRVTVNVELGELQMFLRFLTDQGHPVCRRTLQVEPLKEGSSLPRDVPIDQLQRLMKEIEVDASASHGNIRRMGILDRAWFLLMLHSGLRTGEIRRLRHADLDLDGRRVRIEQSKGLKDRVVYLSAPTVQALHAYLMVRGPAATDHVFIYRHKSLSASYCGQRLRTYGRRCGVKVTCHQLRHSCATLLLNAGAPILTVQTILGHKHIDTTLTYARLYDGTVATDYYTAMAEVESRMGMEGSDKALTTHPGELLALVDSLSSGTLNDAQREMVQALRRNILVMVERSA